MFVVYLYLVSNMVYISESTNDTLNIGKELAERLTGGEVIALYGDLGVGKTHLISGLAQGLGFQGETSSPTFAIVNEYRGGRLPLFHFDMYRISGWEDLETTGFFDYSEEGGIIATEWSENIEAALPENHIKITISRIDDNTREITVEGI